MASLWLALKGRLNVAGEPPERDEAAFKSAVADLATDAGSIIKITNLLETSPNLKNTKIPLADGSVVSALYFAANKNSIELVKNMVKQGVPITFKPSKIGPQPSAVTPIHVAVLKRNKEMLKLLLEYELDRLLLQADVPVINKRNEEKKTALDIALENNYLEITRLLIKYGAQVSQFDVGGDPQKTLASMNKWTRQFSETEINLARVFHIFDRGIQELGQVEQKDIVLIIGDTGAGKSTLVNYLQGTRFQQNPKISSPVPLGNVTAEIGYNAARSQTVFAQCFAIAKDFEICDCPGFLDNRGEEFQMISYMLLRYVIQKTHAVKSICVVIEYATFQVARGANLINLASNLGVMLEKVTNPVGSVVFVYTKVPQHMQKKDIENLITEFIDFRERLTEDDNEYVNESKETVKKKTNNSDILLTLHLMQDSIDRSVVLNLFSDASKQEIYETLANSVPVPKDELFSSMRDPIRANLDKAVYAMIDVANPLLRDLNSHYQAMKDSLVRAQEQRELVETLTLKHESWSDAQKFISRLELKRTQVENKIGEVTHAALQCRKDLEGVLRMLHLIDTGDLETQWESTFKCRPVFGSSRKTFELRGVKGFDANVIKIDNNTGKFYNELVDPAQGIYEVQFRSNKFTAANAKVTIRIPRRLHQPNPSIINTLRLLEVQSRIKLIGLVDDINRELEKVQDSLKQQLLSGLTSHTEHGQTWYRYNGILSFPEEKAQLAAELDVINTALTKQRAGDSNAGESINQSLEEAKRHRESELSNMVSLRDGWKPLADEIEDIHYLLATLNTIVKTFNFNSDPVQPAGEFIKNFQVYCRLTNKTLPETNPFTLTKPFQELNNIS